MLQLGVWQILPAVERHTVTRQTVLTLPFLMNDDPLHKTGQSYTNTTTNLD